MKRRWRSDNAVCTTLETQVDRHRDPRRVGGWGVVMKIWAEEIRRRGEKRSSNSVASCDDLRPRWNGLWARSPRSSVRSPTIGQLGWTHRSYDTWGR